MVVYLLLTLFFIFILYRLILKPRWERKVIDHLKSDKEISLRLLNFYIWLFSPDFSFRRALHYYLARKLTTFKYIENGFLNYFGTTRYNLLGLFISEMCINDETIGKHLIVLGKNYICKHNSAQSLEKLEKLLRFPYYNDMGFCLSVMHIMEEGKWSWLREKAKQVA